MIMFISWMDIIDQMYPFNNLMSKLTIINKKINLGKYSSLIKIQDDIRDQYHFLNAITDCTEYQYQNLDQYDILNLTKIMIQYYQLTKDFFLKGSICGIKILELCFGNSRNLEVTKYLVNRFNITYEDVKDWIEGTIHRIILSPKYDLLRYIIETFDISKEVILQNNCAYLYDIAVYGDHDFVRFLIRRYQLTIADFLKHNYRVVPKLFTEGNYCTGKILLQLGRGDDAKRGNVETMRSEKTWRHYLMIQSTHQMISKSFDELIKII